jgi:hypothetical protein
MTDISDASDLIGTAREALLRDLLPALSAEHRYTALMIANGMAIASREHRLGTDAARSEAARLRNLLAQADIAAPAMSSETGETALATLRGATKAAIRAGRFDAPARAAVLTTELTRIAEDVVAISNPKALRD